MSEFERTVAELAEMKERIRATTARPDGGEFGAVFAALKGAGEAIDQLTADAVAAILEEKRKPIPALEAKVAEAQASLNALQVRGQAAPGGPLTPPPPFALSPSDARGGGLRHPLRVAGRG